MHHWSLTGCKGPSGCWVAFGTGEVYRTPDAKPIKPLTRPDTPNGKSQSPVLQRGSQLPQAARSQRGIFLGGSCFKTGSLSLCPHSRCRVIVLWTMCAASGPNFTQSPKSVFCRCAQQDEEVYIVGISSSSVTVDQMQAN